jgi:hypothetical protein
MSRHPVRVLALCIVLALVCKPTSGAVIDANTVLGPDHPFHDETLVIINGLNPPTKVTVLDGALIGDVNGEPFVPIGLDVFGQSEILMIGGGIGGVQRAAVLHDDSLFHMLAGTIDLSGIEARDMSRVIVDNGEWRGVNAYDSSRVRINGGDDNSTFFVKTFGESHAVINSNVHLDFIADESSTMVINGGVFEMAFARGNSQLLINGGHYVTGLFVFDSAVVRIRGIDDITEEYIDVGDTAIVDIYGTGLHFDFDNESRPLVVGTLADGDDIAARYRLRDQGQIILHEVPEPAARALGALSAMGFLLLPPLRRRRPRR